MAVQVAGGQGITVEIVVDDYLVVAYESANDGVGNEARTASDKIGFHCLMLILLDHSF